MSDITRAFVLLVVCAACSKRDTSVAELQRADAPAEREAQGSAARPAPVGTKFYLGDLVRSTTGIAQLVLRDHSQIAMRPHTALRFVLRAGTTALEIDDGEITLDGTGKYVLEVGLLTLEKGSIRIVGGKRPSLELVFGRGELVDQRGEHRPLEVSKAYLLELGQGELAQPPDAGVDAAPSDRVTIEVNGEGATMQAPGETRWTKLALGAGTLAPGTRIALDAQTTAIVGLRGTTVELLPGTRASVTDALELVIDRGVAVAKAGPGEGTPIMVPGGRVVPNAGAETTIRVGADGDAEVAAVSGSTQLIGKRGSASVEVRQGDSARVRAGGTVAPGELVIPGYFDLEVRVGDAPNMTVHDPAGATAVQFEFADHCKGGGVIELARDAKFGAPLVSVGDTSAKLLVRAGTWMYRLRCRGASSAGAGRIAVVRDPGTRPLPRDPPRYEISADGRNYRLDYQSRIPDVHIRAGGRATSFKLHLVSGKDDRVFSSTTGSFAVPGTSLREREYTFWVERDDGKSKVSTLRIGFDQTAAQAYISSPVDGRPWGPYIDVAGATLPGWTAAIDGKAIPPDKNTRRFSTIVPAPQDAHAIAIQVAHPERGVHMYLRRRNNR